MSIAQYRKVLDKKKAHLNTRKGQQQQLVHERDTIIENTKSSREELMQLQEASILLQRTSEKAREFGKERLEEITTSALQFVFGPDVRFEIELGETAGRPQAEFYLVSNQGGNEVRTKPMESNGGGIVDIIALALRIAVLQIHHDPVINGPIILDEPGKHVSEEYAERMATFLQQMSSHFKRQIIMVTHQPYLAEVADKAFEVQMIGGKSNVKEGISDHATEAVTQ
jgi:DNA repair ATPase RecN